MINARYSVIIELTNERRATMKKSINTEEMLSYIKGEFTKALSVMKAECSGKHAKNGACGYRFINLMIKGDNTLEEIRRKVCFRRLYEYEVLEYVHTII